MFFSLLIILSDLIFFGCFTVVNKFFISYRGSRDLSFQFDFLIFLFNSFVVSGL